MTGFKFLPMEIMPLISKYLSFEDLCSARLVCRHWRTALSQPAVLRNVRYVCMDSFDHPVADKDIGTIQCYQHLSVMQTDNHRRVRHLDLNPELNISSLLFQRELMLTSLELHEIRLGFVSVLLGNRLKKLAMLRELSLLFAPSSAGGSDLLCVKSPSLERLKIGGHVVLSQMHVAAPRLRSLEFCSTINNLAAPLRVLWQFRSQLQEIAVSIDHIDDLQRFRQLQFTQLKSLKLEFGHISDDSLCVEVNEFFSACNTIENLTLVNLGMPLQVISLPNTLKKLTVKGMFLEGRDWDSLSQLNNLMVLSMDLGNIDSFLWHPVTLPRLKELTVLCDDDIGDDYLQWKYSICPTLSDDVRLETRLQKTFILEGDATACYLSRHVKIIGISPMRNSWLSYRPPYFWPPGEELYPSYGFIPANIRNRYLPSLKKITEEYTCSG